MNNDDAFVCEKIRQLRILHNCTQEELGKFLNLPKQAISRIEKGKRKVSYSELIKISEFLKEPIEAFAEKDIKYKLLLREYRAIAIPKFAIDFLEDYRIFVKDHRPTDMETIAKQIFIEMNAIYMIKIPT